MKIKQVLPLAFVSLFLAGLVSAADAPPAEMTGETAAAADSAPAQPAAKNDATELAKQTQNPVADLISLPLQNNTYFEVGPDGRTQNVLLVQPVVPVGLNDDWNLINRPIIPIINQPAMTDDQNRNGGLGNIQYQGFFSPKKPVGGWILGLGPYLEFPTNSNPDGQFGTDNYSAGPAFVALQMKGHWVYGALFTHLWSYHGNDPETNLTGFQPIINYNLEDGWYVKYSPVWSLDWTADSNNQWTIPVGAGFGKVFHLGKQPVNASIASYYMVESPDNGPDWQLQCQLQFLFPK
ncbi:MAG: neuromedin U [Planctomycetota bacterium]|jgi:hypothetical protein